MKLTLVLGTCLLPLTLWSQESVELQLKSASQLGAQGQYAGEIELLKPLTKTNLHLTALERIRAWFLLGLAYEQTGQFQDAASAFDQALHLTREANADPAVAAAILTAYSVLYSDIGQPDAALTIELNALHLYEKSNNHAGISLVCRSLAEMALNQKQVEAGRQYLQRAVAESRNAGEMNDNFIASLAATQAKLAEMEHNPSEAISGFLQAIKLWEHSHGEEYSSVGWGYVQLGRATAEAGNMQKAMADAQKGLGILTQTLGSGSVKYYSAQLVYASLLEKSGANREGAELKKKAEESLQKFYRQQHDQGTLSAAALSFK